MCLRRPNHRFSKQPSLSPRTRRAEVPECFTRSKFHPEASEAMRPTAQTGASLASRSSSTSNAFWNPYNHPSETSSRSSCEGEDLSRNHFPAEEERTLEDAGEAVPPPGGFLCPDGGYFHVQAAESSDEEGPEPDNQPRGSLQPYPAQWEGKSGESRHHAPGPCKDPAMAPEHLAPRNPGSVEQANPVMPCTPGRVFSMFQEKKSRTWQKPLPPGAVKQDAERAEQT